MNIHYYFFLLTSTTINLVHLLESKYSLSVTCLEYEDNIWFLCVTIFHNINSKIFFAVGV